MAEIPQKIQKGRPVREQAELKINAIIDCLRSMRLRGDGDRIRVSETPDGTIISFANTGAVKEVVETRQVIPWQYTGPWQCYISADRLNLETTPGPLEINGRFLSSQQIDTGWDPKPLSQIFSGYPGTSAKTLYITICCYLLAGQTAGTYEWGVARNFFDPSQLVALWNEEEIGIPYGGRGYAVIGQVRRVPPSQPGGSVTYEVGQYIPGIPQIMCCAYTQTTPAVDRYLREVPNA